MLVLILLGYILLLFVKVTECGFDDILKKYCQNQYSVILVFAKNSLILLKYLLQGKYLILAKKMVTDNCYRCCVIINKRLKYDRTANQMALRSALENKVRSQ